MRLILASASPRRAELLKTAGFEFDVLVADVNEQAHLGEEPPAYVRRLAMEKSAAAVARLQGMAGQDWSDAVVLAADTAVVVDGEILGKPKDADEARAMLQKLSGRRHEVLTGISLRRGGEETGGVEHSGVYFAELGDEELSWYVQSGEGMDKAGAYAIQGLASRFVWRLEGSHANVVGLPVATVYELLREPFGWPAT